MLLLLCRCHLCCCCAVVVYLLCVIVLLLFSCCFIVVLLLCCFDQYITYALTYIAHSVWRNLLFSFYCSLLFYFLFHCGNVRGVLGGVHFCSS